MKYGLVIMGILFCSLSLWGQRRALPNPDRYPADTILIMLREDTVANQFKAWVINRTDSTVMLDAFNREVEDWLEVKDDEGTWRVYNSHARTWIKCGTGLTYAFPLRRNDFAKVSSTRTPGTFNTLTRARFTLDSVAYYSSEMAVSIDTSEFLHPDLRQMVHSLRRMHKDSNKFQSWLNLLQGWQYVKKERYIEARKKYAKALELDSTNYQVIIAQGDLRLRQISKVKLEEAEISRMIRAVFTIYEIIPTTEEELQEKIERRRKAYARWLED